MIARLDSKQKMLALALLLTLAAAAWLATQDDDSAVDVVEVPTKKHLDAPQAAAADGLPVLPVFAERQYADGDAASSTNLFKAQRKMAVLTPAAIAAQEQAAAEAAAPPQAPALPFTYLGTVDDNGSNIIFLSKDQRLYTIKIGDTLDGQYRLEEAGKTSLQFLYLPLNIKQSLNKAGVS